MVDTAVDIDHSISRVVFAATDPTVPNAISVFAKADEITQISLFMRDSAGGGTLEAVFDLSLGTVLSATETGTGANAAAIIKALANGWYRCILTGTPATSGTTIDGFIFLAKNGGTSYLGNGSDGAHIWGVNIEESPFSSSYIGTVAAAVTRTADSLDVTIEENIPLQANALTIAFDVNVFGFDGTQTGIQVPGESNRVVQVSRVATSFRLILFYGNSSISGGAGSELTANTVSRIAIKHDGSGAISLWKDGEEIASGTASDVTDSIGTAIAIGYDGVVSEFLNGHISNLRIYDRAFSDEEMSVA